MDTRAAVPAGATREAADADARLAEAERRGLRLAIACQTTTLAAGLVWLVAAYLAIGQAPSLPGIAALAGFILFGALVHRLAGADRDRPWTKYVALGGPVAGVCLILVLMPLSTGGDVPQVVAFRSYGIHLLVPLVAFAVLSLSWRLVLFTGAVAVAGWWAAFLAVVAPMEAPVSWGDLPRGPSREAYLAVLLSPDFVGTSNRVVETGCLAAATVALAIAVARARAVFLAQVAAEAGRKAERAARDRVERVLGRYVPEAVAARLAEDTGALAPQVRHGAVLVMDIAGFTAFAAGRPPEAVIAALDRFLAGAADIVAEAGGVVITFTGDGLLAAFGTPLADEAPERSALSAAMRLDAFARSEGLAVRQGLAAGPVAAGSVGSSRRQTYTVYGETVNRAARLEALGKEEGARILLDAAVAAAAGPDVCGAVALGPRRLKGFSAPVEVWAGDGLRVPG